MTTQDNTESARLSTEELAAIKARADKATEGPWAWDISDGGDIELQIPNGHSVIMGDMEGICGECVANAEFIGLARQDIPRLLDMIASLDEQENKTRLRLLAEVYEAAVCVYRAIFPDEDERPYDITALMLPKSVSVGVAALGVAIEEYSQWERGSIRREQTGLMEE
jgi:hypothetical protein